MVFDPQKGFAISITKHDDPLFKLGPLEKKFIKKPTFLWSLLLRFIPQKKQGQKKKLLFG
jgi:hypothetical protein